MKKRIIGLLFLLGCLVGAASAQTSSASGKQVVSAAKAYASVTLAMTPSIAGQVATYSGVVSGKAAMPTGTVTVIGATGTQTITLTAAGGYSCSETIPNAGTFPITINYNGDSNYLDYLGK